MKKNIVFAGAMAVILGVGNASAATIASKAYVDEKTGTLTELTTTQTTNLVAAINSLKTAVDTKADAKDMEDALQELQDAIDEINGEDGGLLGELKEQLDDLSDLVAADGDNLSAGDATTIVQAVNKIYQTLQGLGDLSTLDSVSTQYIDDSAVTTAKIANGTILEEDLNSELADKLNGKQDKNMGAEHANHIVVTDGSGNITTVAELTIDRITDLGEKLDSAVGDGADSLKSELAALKELVGSGDLSDSEAETILEAVNNLYDDLHTSGILTDDGEIDGSKIKNGTIDKSALSSTLQSTLDSLKALAFKDTVATADIDDGSVTAAKLGDDLANLKALAQAKCDGANLCVLSFDGEDVQWVNVTDPLN